MNKNFPIMDSHMHLLTKKMVDGFREEMKKRDPRLYEEAKRQSEWRAKTLNQPSWEPENEPVEATAKRWLDELDKNQIAKGVFIHFAKDGEELEEFVRFAPDRFVGFIGLNPLDPESPELLERFVNEKGFRGLKLYPLTQKYHVYEERVYPMYEKARKLRIPVLIHMGISIAYTADLRYANPIDLQPVARDFPDLNIIVAHFGAGFMQESLLLCYHCANVYFDTSGSNIWMKYLPYPITLKEVFQKFLENATSDRILYGTDSSTFPRGYRRDLLDLHLSTFRELKLPEEEIQKIFGGNIARLVGISI
ncbi:amidohydrolase [candidate division TA06 bacterium]|nr:amidohydrolase [candidate division TA06 bacterium]